MNEAERCDRISLMHAGKVLACDTPNALIKSRGENSGSKKRSSPVLKKRRLKRSRPKRSATGTTQAAPNVSRGSSFSPRRLLAYARREMLEIRRDPIRLAFALLGDSVIDADFGYGTPWT